MLDGLTITEESMEKLRRAAPSLRLWRRPLMLDGRTITEESL